MTEISSMIISHVKAKIEDIEKSWHGDLGNLLKHMYMHELVNECAVLKTCNRVELYVVSPKGSKVLFNFAKKMKVSNEIVEFYDHDESLMHLLRLSSGLESMIVGEDQILGQINDLYHLAQKAGTTGKVLETAFDKAIHVGKRIRSETGINKGSVSIGSAAVDLAEEQIGNLTGKTILIIGVGEMGTLVATALSHRKVDAIYVANRTFERAEKLADGLCGTAVRYEDMDKYIELSDVVICATAAPHYVITKEIVDPIMKKRVNPNDLLLIDIANPRDIEDSVTDIVGVKLMNIDNLRLISERNMGQRMEEAKKAEVMIAEEFELLKRQYKRQYADDTISSLYSMVDYLRENERDRAINRLRARHGVTEFEESIINDLTHSLTNKLLAQPTKELRKAAEVHDEAFFDYTQRLFNLRADKARTGNGDGNNAKDAKGDKPGC